MVEPVSFKTPGLHCAAVLIAYHALVWESEAWLKENAKPVGQGGVGALNPGNIEREGEGADEGQADDAMEE